MLLVLPLILLAICIRVFVFQPFTIPSGSMMDTLVPGESVAVSKSAYGYGRYSAPFGLFGFEGRVLASPPERGDVVVFALETPTGVVDYVKRVVGLPGETIQMRGGVLHIDGVAVPRARVADYMASDGTGTEQPAPRFVETLPNGVSYDTLDVDPAGPLDDTAAYEVPEGHYFMLGDNRDNSADSRLLDGVGYVPFDNLVGRVEGVYYSAATGRFGWRPVAGPRADARGGDPAGASGGG